MVTGLPLIGVAADDPPGWFVTLMRPGDEAQAPTPYCAGAVVGVDATSVTFITAAHCSNKGGRFTVGMVATSNEQTCPQSGVVLRHEDGRGDLAVVRAKREKACEGKVQTLAVAGSGGGDRDTLLTARYGGARRIEGVTPIDATACDRIRKAYCTPGTDRCRAVVVGFCANLGDFAAKDDDSGAPAVLESRDHEPLLKGVLSTELGRGVGEISAATEGAKFATLVMRGPFSLTPPQLEPGQGWGGGRWAMPERYLVVKERLEAAKRGIERLLQRPEIRGSSR